MYLKCFTGHKEPGAKHKCAMGVMNVHPPCLREIMQERRVNPVVFREAANKHQIVS